MNDMIAPRDMFGKTLIELGETNKNIFVVNADVSKATKTEEFGRRFPDRFINVGICEQNMAGVAAGLARAGFIPVMSTFASFAPGRCYDQIRQSIAYSNLNVKVISTHPGLATGADGAMHQCLDDVGIMRMLPNFTVLTPSDHVETRKAVIKAVEHEGPVYIRVGRKECPVLFRQDWEFEIGRAYTLMEGSDITFIAHGSMVHIGYEAAQELSGEGISVRVIDMPTIKPIDRDAIIEASLDTGRILTIEDHFLYGGLYSSVCEITSRYAPCMVMGIGMDDRFAESGTPDELYAKYGFDKAHIKLTAHDMLKEKMKNVI